MDDRRELGVRFNTCKTTRRLIRKHQEAPVSQRLLLKMFRSTFVLKACVEDEPGSDTTKMSQLSRMKLFWPDLKHWINVKKLLITPEQTTQSWCGFKFTLMSCWNEITEAENEQEISYRLRRIIEDVQLFLI